MHAMLLRLLLIYDESNNAGCSPHTRTTEGSPPWSIGEQGLGPRLPVPLPRKVYGKAQTISCSGPRGAQGTAMSLVEPSCEGPLTQPTGAMALPCALTDSPPQPQLCPSSDVRLHAVTLHARVFHCLGACWHLHAQLAAHGGAAQGAVHASARAAQASMCLMWQLQLPVRDEAATRSLPRLLLLLLTVHGYAKSCWQLRAEPPGPR